MTWYPLCPWVLAGGSFSHGGSADEGARSPGAQLLGGGARSPVLAKPTCSWEEWGGLPGHTQG